tara:strand:- start:785 stop:991 length:207 start_codon:yes stop_codon:yes gene_type:complete
MEYAEAIDLVQTTKTTLDNTDRLVAKLIPMMVGRLKQAERFDFRVHYHLKALKRELRDFNATTGQWKK